MPTEKVICGALSLSCSIGRTGPRRLRVPSPAPDRLPLWRSFGMTPQTGNYLGLDGKWYQQYTLVSSPT
jgi:hypothetical protein